MNFTKSMVMQAVVAGVGFETFEFNPPGQPPIMYNVTLLRKMLQAGMAGAEVCEVDMALIIPFLLENRVWEQARVDELTAEQWRDDPAIALISGEGDEAEHCFIDGIHRLVRRHKEGEKMARFWQVPQELAPIVTLDSGMHRGPDWGDPIVDGKIVRGA